MNITVFPLQRTFLVPLLFYTFNSQTNGCLYVSVETQKELQLLERDIKDDTSGSEGEEASPDIGHDICLDTYTGSVTVTQSMQLEDIC